MKRVLLALALGVCIPACGGGGSSPAPTAPSPATSTRIISLEGNLAFGNIQVFTTFDAILRIHNNGTAVLTISGLTGPSGYTADWTSGTIAAGASQAVTIRFSPTAEQTYNGTLTINGDQTSGTNTIAISGTGMRPPGPRTSFSDGQYLVGSDIVAGRYFDAPLSSCYWERQSGLGGTLGEIIANNFQGFNAAQWIVDIDPSDKAFKTQSGCGIWSMTPKSAPASATITPGMWLNGSQIAVGTYRADVQSGCYWERLRGFGGTLSAIIANNFVSSAGSQLVAISAGDAGFDTNASCGTWTRVSALTPPLDDMNRLQSFSEIESNWEMNRRKNGLR